MAKRSKAPRAEGARRKRRTPEEIIADLQKRIEDVKLRQQTRELKQSPAVRAVLAAVKALDKALRAAEEESDNALRHSLADARAPLEALLSERGIPLRKTRRPKGPRPK